MLLKKGSLESPGIGQGQTGRKPSRFTAGLCHLVIGSKGIAAYADHAAVLGQESDDIYGFLMQGLASTTKDLSVDDMVGMVMKAGDTAVNTMALLDQANTAAYVHPEITEVNIGVGKNPGILISGHDLKDIDELLKQTEGTGG